jgi:hypothetical protein
MAKPSQRNAEILSRRHENLFHGSLLLLLSTAIRKPLAQKMRRYRRDRNGRKRAKEFA